MRGLTAVEWDLLENAAAPDPCDDMIECSDYDANEEAAIDRITRRGLVIWQSCIFDPTDEHPTPTPSGKLLLRLGHAVVVSDEPPTTSPTG